MIESDHIVIPTKTLQLITSDQAWHYGILPLDYSADKIKFFVSQKANSENLREELEMLFGLKVEFELLSEDAIQKSLSKYYRKGSKNGEDEQVKHIKNYSDDFLLNLISEANQCGSSDIHLESYEEKCRVRMRIDGKLIERYVVEKEDYPAYINKIKIRSNLDIAEKRLPQDGRIFFHEGNEKFDIRVSILPTLYGEKVVLRLLSKDATQIEISHLGFQRRQMEDYRQGIKRPHGIILISGPTGSGKTTTLYATLKILNQIHTNILTIEDPIEYTLEGINQVQLKESIGLSFSSALRTFLRQDPDVIMLGEIRDSETAQMAIRAALTGHLVLSTVHTNSAWGTVSRLIDMGVPSFLLASTLNLTVAQRLIRLLCPDCKQKLPSGPNSEFLQWFNKNPPKEEYVPQGCGKCFFTGFRGRTAVYEVIPIDSLLSEKIKQGELDIKDTLKEKKLTSLQDAALRLFSEGKTSYQEIYPIMVSTI